MSDVEAGVLSRIDKLQERYIAALDAQKMDAWLDTFRDEPHATYICTTAESVEAGLPVALVMDDNHARLKDRVQFVTRIWAGTFANYRTRHFIQRTACREVREGVLEVHTNFAVVCTPADTGRSVLSVAGVYLDLVDVSSEQAAFLSKKVIMDSAVVERFMVYPL